MTPLTYNPVKLFIEDQNFLHSNNSRMLLLHSFNDALPLTLSSFLIISKAALNPPHPRRFPPSTVYSSLISRNYNNQLLTKTITSSRPAKTLLSALSLIISLITSQFPNTIPLFPHYLCLFPSYMHIQYFL